MSFFEKRFEDFRRQKKTLLASTKQPRETHDPLMQQSNMDLLTRKK